MAVIIGTIIGIALFYTAIKIIIKYDKATKLIPKNEIGIALVILISNILLYLRYQGSIKYIFMYILFSYLIITSYVDFKTLYVYTIYNYIVIGVGMFYIYINRNIYGISDILVCVTIYAIITYIFAKLNMYGEGDFEVLLAVSMFLSIKYPIHTMEVLLLNMIISNIVAIILNRKKFNIRKFSFDSKIAFVPAISISTMILLLV